MKNSINMVHLSGRLGKDPESKYTPNGKFVAKTSIAVNESYKVDGVEHKTTSWVSLTFWGSTAEKFVMPYLHKGDEIYVEGKLSIREYTGDDGIKKYFTEIGVSQVRIIKSKNDGGEGHEESQADPASFAPVSDPTVPAEQEILF